MCHGRQERRYDAGRGMSLLVEDFVSRASALQRRGRAGRVRAGHCFGLYTRFRFEHRLRKFQVPACCVAACWCLAAMQVLCAAAKHVLCVP